MTLKEFLKAAGKDGCESQIVVYRSEIAALAAVQQNGDALRYVQIFV